MIEIFEDESETRKWYLDQISPVHPNLERQSPKSLLMERILEKLSFVEDFIIEVENSYNKGVWNRNAHNKEQKMAAVVKMGEEEDKKEKKEWSKALLKKFFIKKRSQSKDSFFGSQDEEVVSQFSVNFPLIFSKNVQFTLGWTFEFPALLNWLTTEKWFVNNVEKWRENLKLVLRFEFPALLNWLTIEKWFAKIVEKWREVLTLDQRFEFPAHLNWLTTEKL